MSGIGIGIGSSSSSDDDLRRPLLLSPGRNNNNNNDASGDEEERRRRRRRRQEERTAAIVEEWNASVSAFVAENGGDDNVGCFLTKEGLERTATTTTTTTTTTRTTDGQPCEDGAEHRMHDNDDDGYGDDDGDDDGNDSTVVVGDVDWPEIVASKLAAICQVTLLPDALPTVGSGYDYDDDDDDDDENENENDENENENENDPSDRVRREHRIRRRSTEFGAHVKFLKLVVLTFGSIALVRGAVLAAGISDRDRSLAFSEILRYEGDSILRDLAVFFVVGRLHRRRGIDTLEWFGFGLLANLYFESQAFVGWMRHSVTPYEMRCLWPWQLWAFAAVVVVPGIAGLVVAHAVAAVREGCFRVALAELLASIAFFVLPVAASPYAHFHHWFAGWLFGMHANLHRKWWSRAAMAYCWGVYVNGIAVYGRDPLLTCDYARFLAVDQSCPHPVLSGAQGDAEADGGWRRDPPASISAGSDLGISAEIASWMIRGVVGGGGGDDDSGAPDWRNCSGSGYHP